MSDKSRNIGRHTICRPWTILEAKGLNVLKIMCYVTICVTSKIKLYFPYIELSNLNGTNKSIFRYSNKLPTFTVPFYIKFSYHKLVNEYQLRNIRKCKLCSPNFCKFAIPCISHANYALHHVFLISDLIKFFQKLSLSLRISKE